jgi:hypothetical protein
MKIHHIPEHRPYVSVTVAEFLILIALSGFTVGQIVWTFVQS